MGIVYILEIAKGDGCTIEQINTTEYLLKYALKWLMMNSCYMNFDPI
jgi:hypothetical protein